MALSRENDIVLRSNLVFWSRGLATRIALDDSDLDRGGSGSRPGGGWSQETRGHTCCPDSSGVGDGPMTMRLTLELHQLPEAEVRRGWVRIHESQRRGIKAGELIEMNGQSGTVLRVVYGLPPGYKIGTVGAAANWLCMDEPTRLQVGLAEATLGSEVSVNVRGFPLWCRWTKWICYSLRHPEITLKVGSWLALILGGLSVVLGLVSVILTIISVSR